MSDHGMDSPGNDVGIDSDFVDRQIVEEALERLLIGDDHMGTQPEEAFGRLMLKQNQLRESLDEAIDAVIWFSGLDIPPGAQESWEEIRDEQMPKWRELLKESQND